MVNHSAQFDPRSPIDTWLKQRKKPTSSSSSSSKSIHQQIHIQARSKIDTWTSKSSSKTLYAHRIVSIEKEL